MNKVFPTIIIFLAVTSVFFTLFGNHGLIHLQKIDYELKLLEDKNHLIQSDISQLQNEIITVKQDPFTLEKHARERLSLSRKGEIVYTFIPQENEQ